MTLRELARRESRGGCRGKCVRIRHHRRGCDRGRCRGKAGRWRGEGCRWRHGSWSGRLRAEGHSSRRRDHRAAEWIDGIGIGERCGLRNRCGCSGHRRGGGRSYRGRCCGNGCGRRSDGSRRGRRNANHRRFHQRFSGGCCRFGCRCRRRCAAAWATRRRCPGAGDHRRCIDHEHGPLELRRCGSFQVKTAFLACRCTVFILRAAVRTKHSTYLRWRPPGSTGPWRSVHALYP